MYCPHYEGMDRVCQKCVEQQCLRQLTPFEKYINERWDYLNDSSAEVAFKHYIESSKKKGRNFLYLTLSPDKKLRNLLPTTENIKAVDTWARDWFEWGLKRWYKGYIYTIESGSQNDHLHMHIVVELKSSHKHAELLKRSWARSFPSNALVTTLNIGSKVAGARGEYAYLRFDDLDILQDKIDYFDNERKGCHSNLIDLGLRGSGGSLTYSGGQ